MNPLRLIEGPFHKWPNWALMIFAVLISPILAIYAVLRFSGWLCEVVWNECTTRVYFIGESADAIRELESQ